MAEEKPVGPAVLRVLGCADCPAGSGFIRVGDALVCSACSIRHPIGPHGVVNALEPMSDEVRRELEGMRREHPDRYPTLESKILPRVDRTSTFAERKASTANSPKDYYLSTELNFRYALDRIPLTGRETVLEIGAEHDMPFLQPFRERGCTCFGTNIFYFVCPTEPPADGVHVVLGDMNRLPYRTGSFDVVLASATTHHSPDLRGLIAELARVTRPGGRVLILNDPSSGLVKHALDRCGGYGGKGGDRDDLIHENEYSPLAYRRLARANGLRLEESFFSVYYDLKLRTGNVRGVRFAPLARAVSLVWRVPPIRWLFRRVLLLPSQLLIGLELNMIFRKADDG